MKRYLLFVYDDYYPRGGWHDFVGSFDTVEAAVLDTARRGDKFHVIDSTTWKAVQLELMGSDEPVDRT